jgi:hypothetical protein
VLVLLRLSLVLALGGLAACSFRYEPTAAGDPVEEMLLAETARFAGQLGLKVRGEITDTISKAQQTSGIPDPTAWYSGGVAWYYRPRVRETVSLEPEPGHETATNVAAHEVCHAVSRFHDLEHWTCQAEIATPTYPKPNGGVR